MGKRNSQASDFEVRSDSFGNDFAWGVSIAAYQNEGAYNLDGKGKSIWDTFTARKGKIYKNQNAKVATDFYHRYEEDIKLMASMGIKHFRFSISWSRILPKGTGTINADGIQFYHQVIDSCLQHKITPWITLYHWDLPQELETQGGWTNRKVIDWFTAYVQLCADSFGDKVKNWMILNEPMVFTGAGYFLGVHAPGRRGLRNFLPAVHHAVLCQAAGGRIIRASVADANIGTTFSCSLIEPYKNRPRDIAAAKRVDLLLNRLFIEPLLGKGYPMEDIKAMQRLKKYILQGDMEDAIFDFDFIGIQNYTRELIKHSYFTPYISAKIVKASKRNVKATLMGWEVYPKGLYEMIKKFSAYDEVTNLIVTENGAAFMDHISENGIQDTDRLHYLQSYIKEMHRAKKDGYTVDGYFVWTFTDNFEWAEGYYPRFGLVHVDFESQKRTIKLSGKWWKSFLTASKKTPTGI